MAKKTKVKSVSYCVGWSLDGPLYVTHYLETDKPQTPHK